MSVGGAEASLMDATASTGGRSEAEAYLRHYAATTIQRHYKGWRCRHTFQQQKRATSTIEAAYAQYREQNDIMDLAARAIQTCWRSHRNRRIYRYYRDLIQFRERGDPRELLRVINPREAQLADAATGVHVRFRLGGTTFPPLVFYKIFTHKPVADINAFGPRNYAAEVRVVPGDIHNKPLAGQQSSPLFGSGLHKPGAPAIASGAALVSSVVGSPQRASQKKRDTADFDLDSSLREYVRPDGTIGYRSTRGWYARCENNGWRPVSDRVLLDEDPITTLTRLKRQPMFHHSPQQRREDRARIAKQRRREWMLKMYRDGILSATGAEAAAAQRRGGAAPDLPDLDEPGALASLATLGEDASLTDAEELLRWSQHLDFESYLEDWTSLACTLGSEAFLPEEEQLGLPELPAPGRNVAAALSAAGAPLVPFKGGVGAACSVMSTGAHLV